jgi:hypothetical protein
VILGVALAGLSRRSAMDASNPSRSGDRPRE